MSYDYNNSFMALEYVTFKLYYKCAVKEDSAAWIHQYKVDGIRFWNDFSDVSYFHTSTDLQLILEQSKRQSKLSKLNPFHFRSGMPYSSTVPYRTKL
jgi:hypothetical protein